MSRTLVYVDRSKVREGSLDELKAAIAELAAFVEENEPRLIAYNAYFSEDGGEMTVMHIHADPESLDTHMEVAGPRFARFAELLTLRSIEIYGEPSKKALEALRAKARQLGASEVTVHPHHAGFIRG